MLLSNPVSEALHVLLPTPPHGFVFFFARFYVILLLHIVHIAIFLLEYELPVPEQYLCKSSAQHSAWHRVGAHIYLMSE